MGNGERIGAAYDAVAEDYDRQLEPVRWIRRILWRHFDRLFRPGDRVLDVGCGTGSDTVYLAKRRVRVTAIDASAGMLARLRVGLAAASPALDVEAMHGDIDELAPQLTGPFDGIISSFAALNTVDLATFAPQAARLLRPGGRLVCHMISTAYGRKKLPHLLARGVSIPNAKTISVGGVPLEHLNLDPEAVYRRFFEAQFASRGRYALGLLVSGEMEAWLPARVLDWAGRIEPIIGAFRPLVGWGRFFVMDLERRSG